MKHLCMLAVAVAALTLTAPSFASSTRSLSDAHVGSSKTELLAQKKYSSRVVASLAGTWRVAPRHATCWSRVPWSHVCDQARRRLIAHRWLLRVATDRLDRLYPARQPIEASLLSAFTCIHNYEGAWNANTGNGYYGGLQFGWNEWQRFGGRFASRADLATPAEQIEAGIAYYRVSGFSPWPRTARFCGLL